MDLAWKNQNERPGEKRSWIWVKRPNQKHYLTFGTLKQNQKVFMGFSLDIRLSLLESLKEDNRLFVTAEFDTAISKKAIVISRQTSKKAWYNN